MSGILRDLLFPFVIGCVGGLYIYSWFVFCKGFRAVLSFRKLKSMPPSVASDMYQVLTSDWYLSLIVPLWSLRVRKRLITQLRVSWSRELQRQMDVDALSGKDTTFRGVLSAIRMLQQAGQNRE